TGLPEPKVKPTYQFTEMVDLVRGNHNTVPPVWAPLDVDFALSPPPDKKTRRLIERTKHVYLGDETNDDRLLALGLPVEVRRAVLTPTLLDKVYKSLVTDQMLKDNRYVNEAGLWWAPSGKTDYAPELFYQARQFTDPFGTVSSVEYDGYA